MCFCIPPAFTTHFYTVCVRIHSLFVTFVPMLCYSISFLFIYSLRIVSHALKRNESTIAALQQQQQQAAAVETQEDK